MLDEQLGDTMTRLHTSLVAATQVEQVVTAVVDSAAAAMAGASEVSVTLRRNGAYRTVGASGERALRCDEAEYEAAAGPCLDAADTSLTVLAPDLSTEVRWPHWTRTALAEGFAGGAAFPVGGADTTVALNVYCESPIEWDDRTVVIGQRYAAELSRILDYSVRLVDLATETSDLRAAMESRSVIDQAIGIVMAQNRCSADAALDLLRRASQRQNLKLRDLALSMVERVGGAESEILFVQRS
ncbi:ANTAR domain-containing protein [Cellulomonas sp. S1-8]|uniref:ANTAR domain-containing protein n=1 Tax=Cellulomonas sp. S1-8 TaxID=2904790 RepID=UPI0022437DD7|nr:ANTAR domain-containing protein [Cellulomonas sp. S1-8]UZN03916.1 ANTAR domain-containing protein [Cellulomonas sp. S1-8]